MTPEEHGDMKAAFERNSVVGYKDVEYNVVTRKYICIFTQGRWIDWQNAWLAGQRYRPGKKTEEAVRPARVARTVRS